MSLVDSHTNLSQLTGSQSCASGPVHTAFTVTTGRPDVVIAVMDSGIEWNNPDKMNQLRKKVRINRGELPYPEVSGPSLDPGADCTTYHQSGTTWDVNNDGVFNVMDYACDPRVTVHGGPRHGPDGVLTPEDLIIAFGNCTISGGVLGTCTPGQHFDNDHNGFVNDIAGWDFVDNNNDPYDDVQYGHGTGEARDSNAEANNGGDLGTCPNCMVVPLRVGESFVADVNRFAQAVLYAVDNGVYVIQEALGTLNNSSLARRPSTTPTTTASR